MKTRMTSRPILILLTLVAACLSWNCFGGTNSQWRLDAGPLKLDIYVSETAHLFHVVDQISQWSEFCHRQYVRYIDSVDGGLSEEDRKLLAEHSAIRKKHGWGGGLEQTFYTPLDLESALAQGVKEGLLTAQEAQTERRVLTHFQARVERLMSEEAPTLRGFVQQLTTQRANLTTFAEQISRFVGGAKLTVPFYVIADPSPQGLGGGGFNGGRLTLEIIKGSDMYPTMLHELFHAFILTKEETVKKAARSVPGLDEETLNEGLAYAYNPGIVHASGSDPLLAGVAGYLARGSSLKDSYARFNTYGLALRPLLKEALPDKRQTLETFLPRATDAWLVLAELDKAHSMQSDSQAHDYRTDPRHSIFIFGLYDEKAARSLMESTGRHYFGRYHVANQYEEMLTKNAKPGDTIVLLLSLDDKGRVPETFSDLLPSPWTEIESRLKQGETVLVKGKARDMTVFLLATPTVESLRNAFRQAVAERKFSS
jgi:hypothetical protein